MFARSAYNVLRVGEVRLRCLPPTWSACIRLEHVVRRRISPMPRRSADQSERGLEAPMTFGLLANAFGTSG